MAGGYTHLTLVRNAITNASNNAFKDAATPAQRLLGGQVLDLWGRYAYLGGVSPDYPYLGLNAGWADRMHKGKTGTMIRTAMPIIHAARHQAPDSQLWRQHFSWLLGFVSHMVADVVIHPVVNIKVGPYEANKVDHRRCEMNQDVWIYKEVVKLDLTYSDNMKGEIRGCGKPYDLDDGVEELWSRCLDAAYGEKPGEDQIDWWHTAFLKLVDFAEDAGRAPVFGRHIVEGANAYPQDPDHTFIDSLLVPTSDTVTAELEQPVDRGTPLPFRTIYDKALTHIEEAWSILAEDMVADQLGQRHVTLFGDWSLDTGIDHATGRLRLWPVGKSLFVEG
jgi:hypothetical protein